MKIEKKKVYSALLILFCALMIVRTGCVESVTDSTSTSTAAPTIEISSPLTGDTVYVGDNAITYTATDPSGEGITSYEVFINGTSTSLFEVGSSSTTSIDIYLQIPETFLSQRIKYYVIVYSSSGKYKKSSEQTNLLVRPALPKAPGKLRIAKESDTKFNLTWVDSSDNENRFEVWRKDGLSGTYKLLKSLSENQFYTEDIVSSVYTIYFYKVRAGHSTGVSEFSNEVNSFIAPSNLKATSTAVTTVQLSWTDNSAFESGFRVERALVSDSSYEWIGRTLTNVTTYSDSTVLAGTAYVYRVAAYTETATSPYSSTVSITTPDVETPPSLLTADFNYSTRKVVLNWTSSNYSTTYIERKTGSSGKFSQIASMSSVLTTTYSDSTVSQGLLYYYRVRELSSSGLYYTEYSNIDTVYVPYMAPVTPTNLTIGKVSDYLYSFVWDDNSDDEDGFKLYRKIGSTGSWEYVYTFDANYHAGSVTVPSSSALFSFKITAYKTVSGVTYESDYSNEVSTSELGTWALSLVSVTSSSVKVKWLDNYTDEVFFSLERKIEGGTYAQVALITASSGSGSYVTYTDSDEDLLPGITYVYRVRAVFNIGYSGYSNELSATTSVL